MGTCGSGVGDTGTLCRVLGFPATLLYIWSWCRMVLNANCGWKRKKCLARTNRKTRQSLVWWMLTLHSGQSRVSDPPVVPAFNFHSEIIPITGRRWGWGWGMWHCLLGSEGPPDSWLSTPVGAGGARRAGKPEQWLFPFLSTTTGSGHECRGRECVSETAQLPVNYMGSCNSLSNPRHY